MLRYLYNYEISVCDAGMRQHCLRSSMRPAVFLYKTVVLISLIMTTSSNDTFPLVDLIEQSAATSDSPILMLTTPPPPAISEQYDFDWVEYMVDLTGVRTSWSEDRAFLPATTVYSLTFVLGILGNGFVILALLSGWRVGRTNEGL